MPRIKSQTYNESDEILSTDPSELTDEIYRLRQREKLVLRKKLAIEMELQSIIADRNMYKRKYLDAQSKLSQLNSNPYPVATVEAILKDDAGRAVIRLI